MIGQLLRTAALGFARASLLFVIGTVALIALVMAKRNEVPPFFRLKVTCQTTATCLLITQGIMDIRSGEDTPQRTQN
ncbi:hypothetical protein PDO_5190 [Rhizobium sp. PDO1-076]|nr:hypothetical protein PDO_5190 [Rhizobium sp. PDO1-076]